MQRIIELIQSAEAILRMGHVFFHSAPYSIILGVANWPVVRRFDLTNGWYISDPNTHPGISPESRIPGATFGAANHVVFHGLKGI